MREARIKDTTPNLTVRSVKEKLAHADLSDMPDTGGTNTDHDSRYLLRSLVNGTFQESFDALVTSDGAIVTMSLEQSGGGDLTMQFSDGNTTLDCTPEATIELTAGTDSSPTSNYIYIPQSTKVLTKSTTGFPTSAEHIKVGYFFVPSAAYVQSDGVYINQNWNDHLAGTDNQGHLTHMAERSRRDGAYYFSGIDPNGTDQSAATSYFDYVGPTEAYWKSTAGVIYQMHRHAPSAKDTRTDDIHVTNWSGDAYHEVNNLADIVADANGNSLSNKYFNVHFFIVGNKTGEYAPVMAMLPTGSYISQTSAENDVDGYDVSSMPREFSLESSTGVLICRMTLRWSGGLTTLNHISTTDLRRRAAEGGGGISGGSNFADNQFTIFDEADVTKIMAFDVGTNVSTGSTRTLKTPDADGNLALTSQADGTIDHGADVTGLTDDDHTIYLLADGTRALTGAWTVGSQNIIGVTTAHLTTLSSTVLSVNSVGGVLKGVGGIVTESAGLNDLADVTGLTGLNSGDILYWISADSAWHHLDRPVALGTYTLKNTQSGDLKWAIDAAAVTPTLSQVLVAGNSSGSSDIFMEAAQKVLFRDTALWLNSSVDGQLDVNADGIIQLTAVSSIIAQNFRADSGMLVGLPGAGASVRGFVVDAPTVSYPGIRFNRTATASGDVSIGDTANNYIVFGALGTDSAGHVAFHGGAANLGHELLILDQNDADQAFIDFQGSQGAGTSFNINTTERNTFQAMLMIEINGTKYWLKAYS